MALDTSKQYTLTNNSGKDVVIVLSVRPDETADPNCLTASDGQLEVLKTTDGNAIIKNGSSGTVTLNRQYKAIADNNSYVQEYNLVISESSWLYPLATIRLNQQSTNGSLSYPSQTLNAENGLPMIQAVDFYQTVAVYPNSQLAKDYTHALTAAKEAALLKADGSADASTAISQAIEQKMVAFFKNTQAYQQVTLDDVVAVDHYYNSLPAVWAQYKDNLTYYLYGSDGTTAGFKGTVALQKTGPIDISKSNGGYACLFYPAVISTNPDSTAVDTGKAVKLTYKNGLFVDDPAAQTPAIALKSSFMLKRFFTQNKDDNSVISMLAGKVSGTPCLGFDGPQTSGKQNVKATAAASTSDSAESLWNRLIHPKNQSELIALIFSVIGAVALLPITAFIIINIRRGLKYKALLKTKLDKQAIENDINDLNAGLQQDKEIVFGTDSEIAPPFEYKTIQLSEDAALNCIHAQQLVGAFTAQEGGIRDLMKYQSSMAGDDVISLQSALRYIEGYEKNLNLNSGDPAYVEQVLPEAYKNFQTFQNVLTTVTNKIKSRLSEDALETINEQSLFASVVFDNLQESNAEYNEDQEDVSPEAERIIQLFEK